MRRRLVLGMGLAGVLTGSAVAQFAADAKPLPPQTKAAPFGGAQPPTAPRATTPPTPGYVPPVGGFTPAPATGFTPAAGSIPQPAPTPPPPVEIPTALGVNHPWQLKPEHGAYFITVKSYARPVRPPEREYNARQLAEALGAEIRDTHRTNVFLFEHISEERRAEAVAIAAARAQQKELNDRLDEYRHRSQLQGMEFIGGDKFIRYKTVNYTEQIAVLVGPFKDEDAARKALDTVKKWPPPKQDFLMDGGVIHRQGGGGSSIEKTRINPYAQAWVVPNPSVARARTPGQGDRLDEFIVKLNEGKPYSLLKATKGWTLGVKSFTAPVTVISGGDESTGAMRRPTSRSSDALNAGAGQAEQLAEALRNPNMKPHPFEAFVLHTRNASIVTVGQFDGPDDPSLIETRRVLQAMNASSKVTTDKGGFQPAANVQKLFTDNIIPIPIPRK